MARRLYDLSARDDRRFSSYCWRARFALAHKGLDAEIVPVSFGEKDKIAFSGQPLVPVLVEDGQTIPDSWKIACHLEEKHPSRPSLFGGAVGQAEALFINHWCDKIVQPALAPGLMFSIFQKVRPEDQAYFRESREKRFGHSLETLHAERETHVANFRKVIEPARAVLATQPFLAGDAPRYADYILAGTLQFARLAYKDDVLAADDPVRAWRDRVFDLFGRMAASVPAAAA
ncbi:MAG: glutathione S-transferase family protein [Alphaproteobacteria bacterium]|nr:glutathione S-transferase family protein [Alphaproteobacteria bacterium]